MVTRPYPGSPRLLFPPRSTLLSLANGDHCTPLALFYSVFLLSLSLSLLLFPLSVLDSLLAILSTSLSLSLFLSLFYVSNSIPPSFSFPLSSPLYPREQLPPLRGSPLIPLALSREGTLADAPDVSTVRVSSSPFRSPPPPTQTASSPPPTSLSHPLLQRCYLDPTYVFHPPALLSSLQVGTQAKASSSSSSPRSHLN